MRLGLVVGVFAQFLKVAGGEREHLVGVRHLLHALGLVGDEVAHLLNIGADGAGACGHYDEQQESCRGC